MADAIAFVLRSHRYRAGGLTIGYRACDDWSGATAVFDAKRCQSNGEAYARTRSVLAVLGPLNSGCALALIPRANSAPGGPLAVISPTATLTDLTRKGTTTPAGLPGSLYPTGQRSFARLFPTDDDQGAALAREAKALGAEHVAIVTGGGVRRDDQPPVRDGREAGGPADHGLLRVRPEGLRPRPARPDGRARPSRCRPGRRAAG
jgi:hypothetical protein